MDILDGIEDGIPDPGPDPFAGRDDRDELLVRLVDGRRLEGTLMRVAGMSFMQVRDGSLTPPPSPR